MDRVFKTLAHFVVGAVAVLVAHQVVLGRPLDWWLTDRAAMQILILAGLYGLAAAVVELAFRVERSPWRFSSTRDVFLVIRSTVVTAVAVLLGCFILNRAEYLYRSVLLVAWAVQVGALCGGRLLRRAQYEGAFRSLLRLSRMDVRKGKRLLIVGPLEASDGALRYLERDPDHSYGAVGIITTDQRDRSRVIRNVPVAGSVEDWDDLWSGFVGAGRSPAAILFLAPPNSLLSEEQLGALSRQGTSLIRLPRLVEAEGASESGFAGVKSISIEELLARPTRTLNLDAVTSLVRGRRVFVTGAGGSIGSELCRQAAALECSHLTMLDHSEFLLFEINREIQSSFPTLSTEAVLCNIRSGDRVGQWVRQERPDIVFHAAALKHVPLVEDHPDEGFLTNVIGTRNVSDAAKAAGVSDMVLISTDKAVDPSNTMGATKRLAEEVVRGSGETGETRFTAVRFGNVLGSAGSVVPTFQDQIARGGPVTVTHPDVERYFMTIPEAVQLVLHAVASRGASDSVRASTYVLDMGSPVKIKDLAERLISLSGLAPGRDISIEYVGLRPGEKLTEALVDDQETVLQVGDGVMEIAYPDAAGRPTTEELDIVARLAAAGDGEAVRTAVGELVARLRGGKPA